MKMSEDYGTCGMIRSEFTTHHPQCFRQVINKEVISTELPLQSIVLAMAFITWSKLSALHTRRCKTAEAQSIEHKVVQDGIFSCIYISKSVCNEHTRGLWDIGADKKRSCYASPPVIHKVINKEVISTELPLQSMVLATAFITVSKVPALHTRRHNILEVQSIE
jgi:hypothetical protein